MLKRLIVACLLISAFDALAQDPHLTQYHSIPSYLNPGFTGSNGCGRISAVYRNQWPAIPGTFVNTHMSYEHYLHKLRGGLGLNYLHDMAGEGTLITHRVELTYAAHFELFEKKLVLRPGIGAAYGHKKVNWDKLTFGDMIDPRRGFVYTSQDGINTRKNFFDLSAGVVFSTKYVYGGIAVHHINEPNEGFNGVSRLPMKLTAHVAGMFGEPSGEKKFCLSPHGMVSMQHDFKQILGGITAKYDKYILGIAYRNEDALIAQGAFQMPLFRIGYSYDLTISRLSNATGGSHEITASFNILHKKEKKCTPINTIAF